MKHIYPPAKRQTVAVLFISLFFILLSGCQNQIGTGQNANLEISATYGFDGQYLIGQDNPLHFVIKNNGPAIHGHIVIEVPYSAYRAGELLIPLDIESGVEKHIDEYLALKRVVKALNYKIVANDKTLLSGYTDTLKAVDPVRPVVAVLADSKDKYRTVQSIEFNKLLDDNDRMDYTMKHDPEKTYDALEAFVVYLDNLSTFDKDNALNVFDCIIIGDASNLNIDQAVESQLLRWLNNGGMMIVESGSHFSKTLNQLPNSLKQISAPTEQIQNVDLSAIAEPLVGQITTVHGSVTRQQVSSMTLGDFNVGYLEKLGAGNLLTLSTSLSEGAMQNWNIKSFYLNLIIAQLQQSQQLAQNEFKPWDSYYFNETLNYIPIEHELPIGTIGWLLFVYVFCVGPLLYFILKKIDKRQFLWVIAPLVAVAVIMVVYGIGKATWGNRAISNELSVLKYNQTDNTFYASSQLALFNNANHAAKLSWSGEDIEVQQQEHYYDDYGEEKADKEITYQQVLGDNPHYIDLNATLWQSTRARAQKVIPLSPEQAITALVKIDDNGKQLFIENRSPISLKYTVLVYRGNIYTLNDIEAGDSLTVDIKQLKVFDQNSYQYYQYDDGKLPSEAFFYNLINDYHYELNQVTEPLIMAFSDKTVGYNIQINNTEPKVYSRNIVMITMQQKIAKGMQIELGNYEVDAYYYTLSDGYQNEIYFYDRGRNGERVGENYESAEIYTDYTIPANFEVTEVLIDFDNYYDHSLETRPEDMQDLCYIYNFNSAQYDQLSADDFYDAMWYSVDTSKYLSDLGEIRIRITRDSKMIEREEYVQFKQNSIVVKGEYND